MKYFIFFLILQFKLLAASPELINYQGRFFSESGLEINAVKPFQLTLHSHPSTDAEVYREQLPEVTVTNNTYQFHFGRDGFSSLDVSEVVETTNGNTAQISTSLSTIPADGTLLVSDGVSSWAEGPVPNQGGFTVLRTRPGGRELVITYPSIPPAGRQLLARYKNRSPGIAAALAAEPELWLEITVDGVAQRPRQRILAVPYALNAASAARAEQAGSLTMALDDKGKPILGTVADPAGGAAGQIALPGKAGTLVFSDGRGLDPAAFRAELGINPETMVNVRSHGAAGNGTADDTTAIQAAINAAQKLNRGVFFPDGIYRITAALVVSRSGTRLVGENREFTMIRQDNAAANGISIELGPNAGIWGNQTRRITIVDLNLYGRGAGTSTGRAVNIDGTQTLVGQGVELYGVTLRGWSTGLYNRRCDQTTLRDCVIAFNGTGIDYDTSAHSLVLINTGIARQTVEGIVARAGSGNVIIGGDYGNQPRDIRVVGPQPLTIIGSNHESCIGGTEFISVENNARLTMIGAWFLRGHGLDVPAVRLKGVSLLNVQGLSAGGTFTRLIQKDSNTAIVLGLTGSPGMATPLLQESMEGDQSAVVPWPTIRDDSFLAVSANAGTRGQIYSVISRSGKDDLLVWHGRGSAGGFSAHRLDGRAEAGENKDVKSLRGLSPGAANAPAVSASASPDSGIYFQGSRTSISSQGNPSLTVEPAGIAVVGQVTLNGGVKWLSGTGSPEGVVAAGVGSLYTRTDGAASTTLYVKESGTGSLGWVAK
jgi:hypothetical protein